MRVRRSTDGVLYIWIRELPLSSRAPFEKWLFENRIPVPNIDGEHFQDFALWSDYERWRAEGIGETTND